MHSLNVAMISTYLYPRVGGSEKQLLTLAKALKKKGVRITILTQRYARELPKQDIVDGVTIHRLPVAGAGIWASISFMISLCFYLAKNRRHINIIHVSLASSPAVAAAFVGWMVKKKVIVKLGRGSHYGDIHTSQRTFLGRLKLTLLRNSQAIFIAVSSEIMNELLMCRFNDKKVVRIPNGVDTNVYCPVERSEKYDLRARFGVPERPIAFIFSGRLDEIKNIPRLLDCWSLSNPKENNMFLIIVGEGPEQEKINRYINRLSINETVCVLPFQANIHQFYQLSDIFISLTQSEGLSNALLEAMACGLSIISTAVGGNQEIITHEKNGLLLKEVDNQIVAEKMVELAKDHNKRAVLSKKAIDTIKNQYSINIVAERYERLYML